MKKVFFAAGIILTGLTAAFAQDLKQSTNQQTQRIQQTKQVREMRKVSPEEVAQRKTDRLSRELSLNEDQKKKVHDVLLKEAQDNQGRAAQRQQVNEQLKGIFTAEQNQKYESLKNEKKEMMKQRMEMRSDRKMAPGVAK